VAEAARARAAEAAHTRRTVLIRSLTENAFDLNALPVAPKKRHPPTLPAVGAPQGNRVKKSCGNETCEIVVVPGGDFAFGAEAWLTGSLADQIVGHVL